ncbi:hypothetical protein B990_01124 [Brucella abortus 225/65]|nr:hypothetical protein B990_01124 [Brucella abortus 225/65]
MDEAHEAKPQKDDRIYQVACPALISGDVDGKLLPPIKDGEQCGTHSPLSLTAIGTKEPLRFAHPVTTNCAMAVTLAQWSCAIKKAAKSGLWRRFQNNEDRHRLRLSMPPGEWRIERPYFGTCFRQCARHHVI